MKKDKFLVLRNFTVEPIFSEVEEKLINKKIKPIFEISGYENAYLSLLNSKKKLDEYKGCILILSIDLCYSVPLGIKSAQVSTTLYYPLLLSILVYSLLSLSWT